MYPSSAPFLPAWRRSPNCITVWARVSVSCRWIWRNIWLPISDSISAVKPKRRGGWRRTFGSCLDFGPVGALFSQGLPNVD